jgi:tRNA pseudouridine55 synthase
MRDGIILIDKPAGMSSAGVVARVKRLLKAERVGHAGTLDPDATGLLIILVNGATRVASYAADGSKVYSGVIQLGITTATDDLAGEVISRNEVRCSWDAVEQACKRLLGRIDQIPPKVSAKKLGGKRAYQLHFEGKEFELVARSVEVRRFEVQAVPGNHERFSYLVEVSPGTYVRALARDVGAALGCGAAVGSIRRERSGHFSVLDATNLECVSWDSVRDWGALVPDFPRLGLPPELIRCLIQGQRRGLLEAWGAWRGRDVERIATHVVYHAPDSLESLGILRVLPEGGFDFALNIAQHLRK